MSLSGAINPARVIDRPEVGEPPAWSFPQTQESTLPNGMQLLTVDLPGQHVLSVRVVLPLPLSTEPVGQEGVTLLMGRCLDEGTSAHSAEELALLAERHGIAWGAGAGERGVHVGCEVTARHLPTALELMTECLGEATFPEAEVRRLVRHRLVDISHELADPGTRAQREMLAAYWDDSARPRLPVGGDAVSVSGLGPEELRARHGRLTATGAAVILTGDLSTVGDPVGLVASTIGGWTGSGEEATNPQTPQRSSSALRTILVPLPGLAQTEIVLARPGPDRHTEHGWGAYQTLAMVLGGSPHARIDAVLREQRGYTYGIRAGFRPRSKGGMTVVSGSVRADASVPALRELVEILEVPGSDLTEAEVRAAADFIAMTAPGRYATADAVADELSSLVSDGLPTSTVTSTLADVRALDAQRVGRAWDAVREGAGWTTVLAGDPAMLDGVEELGLGPVTVLDGS